MSYKTKSKFACEFNFDQLSISLMTLILLIVIISCDNNPKSMNNKNVVSPEKPLFADDTHSYSDPDKAYTTHLDLKLKVDFESKTLNGTATYDIRAYDADVIVFDTKMLNITKVTSNIDKDIAYTIGSEDPILGSPLSIPINPETTEVTIHYSTTPESAALLWLDPEQTTDKRLPFLFTQGQAILTRTWIPCQDSPGIRITYDATLEIPDNMLAVMSASNPTERNETGIYTYKMEQPIPPYLIAMAVGDLEFGKIGDRTGVYAEPSMLDKSLFEFGDMEKMLIAAEKLYGPYLWEKYDVIVLPASFPFGGMENPRLTFATPTIIAGDKSLTALIAHELAHSWSGNLVTNATWDDFWLNEGFTVYFERRIMEALYGSDYSNMLALLGYQDLEHTVEDIGHKHGDTHLRLRLAGRDPDDGMTDIAYEKGALFLIMLENHFGRERFDQFVKDYFDKNKFQSMTTDAFIDYLNTNLLNESDEKIDIRAWIDAPGIPDDSFRPKSNKFTHVETAVAKFLNTQIAPEYDWSTHEWLHFIRQLSDELPESSMSILDKAYNFSVSGNSEIAAAWYEKSINTGYDSVNIKNIQEFLLKVGRRKFLTPLYKALLENDQKNIALAIYKKARPNYHAVSRQTLDTLLDL